MLTSNSFAKKILANLEDLLIVSLANKKTLEERGLKIFKTFYKALTVLMSNIQYYSRIKPSLTFFY
jgi:hypothetical protein